MKNKTIVFLFACLSFLSVSGQSLLDKLAKEKMKGFDRVMSTFKGTRVSIGHSVETRKKNTLEITFMSRYWNLPRETGNAFIADRMWTRFGLDYGISDNFTFGVGAGLQDGIIDAYGKYRLMHQSIKKDGNPFSLTVLQAGTYRTKRLNGVYQRDSFSDKLAFTTQLLIARKFSRNFSLQISPSFIHRSSSRFPEDDNNHFAVGFSPRYKVSNHVSFVTEYYYVVNPITSINTENAFVLGVNWELSDLMLQFKMTNNPFFTEDSFITQTRRNFNFRDGNFYFGFHATYHIQF